MTARVPLVIYVHGERQVIGEAEVREDGSVTAYIEHDAGFELVADVDPHYSILPRRDPAHPSFPPPNDLTRPRYKQDESTMCIACREGWCQMALANYEHKLGCPCCLNDHKE
jgi:hypothetical protein